VAVEIKNVAEAEFPAWLDALHLSFLNANRRGDPGTAIEGWDLDRLWGAYDGDRIVATTATIPSELSVPGGVTMPVCLVSAVSVSPDRLRQGLLRTLLHGAHADAMERGEAVSILIPATWPIYGRFGYGLATRHASYTVEASQLTLTADAAAAVAALEPVEIIDRATFRAEAPALHDEVRAARPGSIIRGPRYWDVLSGIVHVPHGPDPTELVFLRVRDASGRTRGVASYLVTDRLVEHRLPRYTLTFHTLISTDVHAEAALWRHAGAHDWVTDIAAKDRPVDSPLSWLLADGRRFRQTSVSDFVWLRVLDVPAALSARRYAADDRLVLEITDVRGARVPDPFGSVGRYQLDAGVDGAYCKPSTATADLRLPLDVLGALYLDGSTPAALAEAGLIDEETPGALDRLGALLRSPRQPYCGIWF
jgi:predicted acetyltransferase